MTYTHEDYTVGWIAALSDELTSAQALLDDEHDALAAVKGDHNAYTLGRIGSHNVVIAGLPEGVIGTNAAGHAATNLFRSFCNVRFAFMVGVGGGVPAANIRLGDVVVSIPECQTGGVIQYDLGTNLQGGEFVRKGFLRDLPSEVLTAVKKLRATARRKGHKLKTYYDEMLKDNPLLKPDFERPSDDNLYDPAYVHTGAKADCSKCDTGKLIKREHRDAPVIHYGLIGSGNQILRNATLRDQLYEDEGIICFEMEAAGLMRNFECLVIRGICDYCDTHKNKHWQPYAGAAAAAYAKELLLTIPAQQVEEMPKNRVLESIDENVRKLVIQTEEAHRSKELRETMKWLAPSDPETNYRSALELREPGTGSWLVESAAYVQWKAGSIKHLWLHGKAGCGKSVIVATIVEDIRSYCKDRTDVGCAMFYFTFSDIKKQSYQDCLRSLVAQIASRDPTSTMLLQAYQASRSSMLEFLPREESLEEILVSAIQFYDQFLLILDALDESPDTLEGNHTTRQKLLKWLQSLSLKAPKLRILATSRHLKDIQDEMGVLEAQPVSMITDFINKDIKKYLKSQLSDDPRLSRFNPAIKTRVEDVFMEKADGMFRWAYCQMRELKNLRSTRASYVEKALLNLPQTLDETYRRMIERIPSELHNDALVLLKWLAYSQRPLTLEELSEAMIIDPYSGDGVVDTNDRGSPEDVLEILSGLIVFIEPEEAILGSQYDDLESDQNETDSDEDNTESTPSVTDSDEDNTESTQSETGSDEDNMNSDKGSMGPDEDDTDYSEQASQGGSCVTRSIRLAHFSVQEYLESTRILESNVKVFHLQKTREQQFLSDCCMVYLMYYVGSNKTTKTKKDPNKFPLLQYVARFWYEHCQDVDDISLPAQFLHSQSSVACWTSVHRVDEKWTKIFRYKDGRRRTGSGLYYAAFMGLSSVVKTLIEEYKVDLNAHGGVFDTALQASSFIGYEQIVRTLIENKADVNAQGGWYNTALQAACGVGREQIVKILIENGANVNIQGGMSGNALNEASHRGKEKIVRILLENGANVNAESGVYGTALITAASNGKEQVVRTLIEEGKANVNAQSAEFGTPLIAVSRLGKEKIARMLIEECKANVNGQGGFYGTALIAACYYGREKMVKMLIEEYKADVNAQYGEYGNALIAACYGGREKIVRMLIEEYNADANAQCGSLHTALVASSLSGHESIVKILIEEGKANVNAQSEEFDTALHAAYKSKGREHIARLLISYGTVEMPL